MYTACSPRCIIAIPAVLTCILFADTTMNYLATLDTSTCILLVLPAVLSYTCCFDVYFICRHHHALFGNIGHFNMYTACSPRCIIAIPAVLTCILFADTTMNYLATLDTSTCMLLVLPAVLSLYLLWNRRKTLPSPPGPSGWPLIGCLYLLDPKPHLTFRKLAYQYGDVFNIRLGTKNCIVISSIEMAKEALVRKGQSFSGRPQLNSGEFHFYI